MNQKILQVAYYFPPIKSIGTLRNYNINDEFQKYFDAVKVITTTNRHRFPKEEMSVKEADITEVPALDYRRFTNNRQKKDAHFAEGLKKRKSVQWIMKLLDSFPFNILIGDGGLIYILKGASKGKRMVREEKITHLYSSFRPYSDHLVAYLIKRKYPDLFWIIDYRDLHVDPINNNVFFKKFQHWCNRKIISRANIVTTVSEGLAVHLKDYSDNVYVMRNGIGKATAGNTQAMQFDKFTLSYTGSMFLNQRDPQVLLATMAKLIQNGQIDPAKIQIVYAGKDGAVWKEWINKYNLVDNFVDKGMVALPVANALQKHCHLNLLLTYSSPKMSGNLTGKFYEYLDAGNPIVLINNGPQDLEFEKIFEDLNAGIVCYPFNEQQTALENFLLLYYKEWLEKGKITSKMNRAKVNAEFTWPGMMQLFMKKLGITN